MPPPAARPPVTLFPPVPKETLKTSAKLDGAVKAAVAALVAAQPGKPPAKFGLSIVDWVGAGPGAIANGGFNDDAEHYAASVVKIGVMYAAYAMLGMVRRYNDLRKPPSPKALFDGLRKEMNGAIEQSSKLIYGGAAARHRLPGYEKMFAVGKAGPKLLIRFQPLYARAIEDMIIPSSNEQTAECIHGLGYSYLNGVLENAGFFDPVGKKGVWVAGDFTGAWPYVRIPSDNDIDTAQGATSRRLVHLMAVIMMDDILTNASHVEMTALLKRSAHGSDPSFLLRPEVGGRLVDSQVSHAKIGFGPLKKKMGGFNVYSEACVLKGVVGSGRSYIAAFTNVDYHPYALDHALVAIKDAIRRYEA